MSEQKVVVITGGTRGIGQVIAGVFRKAGWRVALLARTPPANHLDSHEVLFQAADVTKPDSLEDAANRVLRDWKRLDVWINNAGVGRLIPFERSNGPDWREVFDVNFWGAVHGCRVAIKALGRSDGGSIINVASLTGFQACPGHSAYSTAKAAVIALTRSLAVEYAHQKIRVNAVAPGPVDTEGFRASGGDPASRARSIPTRSMTIPMEIAETCLFLSKPIPSLTGQTILLDGGSAAVGCYAGFLSG
jgi:NAD(P)-dependent dehydrogenase (short-subunit alcohol dehydrogenase family)